MTPFNCYVKVDAKPLLSARHQPYADYANWLQHRILVGRWYWQSKDKGASDFVPLKKRYLEKIIHHRILHPLLAEMFQLGIIERDNRYREGMESIGYRIGKTYAQNPTIRIPCHRTGCSKRIVQGQNSVERLANYTKVHRHLRANLRHVAPRDLATAFALDPDGKQHDLIRYLANGDATEFSVCEQGRVHTAITRLLRPVRGALTYDGLPLLELDIANSQPLFLGLTILKTVSKGATCTGSIMGLPPFRLSLPAGFPDQGMVSSFKRGWKEGATCYVDCSSSPGSPVINPSSPSLLHDHHLCHKPLKYSPLALIWRKPDFKGRSVPYLPADLIRFLTICCEGRLYDLAMKALGWTDSKDAFKDAQVFPTLYGLTKNAPALGEWMQREFPSVWAFIVHHKRRHGYKQLSRDMQKAESRLVIEGVCGRLMTEYPACPVVTVHDSILTTVDWLLTVRKVMLEEFAKLGLTPTIRIKRDSEATSSSGVPLGKVA